MNFCVAILILKIEGKSSIFWHSMFCYFKKGKNATETQKKSCAVYREGAGTDWTCQKRLATFLAGDISLGDTPWSGGLVEVDSNQIKTLTENSQHTQPNQVSKIICTRVVVFITSMFQFHKSDKKNLLDRISACNSLHKHNKNITFLKQNTKSDETWILYNNVDWKRSWGKWNEPPATTPKTRLHPKKVMLCIRWD